VAVSCARGLSATVRRASAGRSYAVESAGAAAAGAGATLAMGFGASTFQIALLAPALGAAATIASAARWPRRRRLALAFLAAAAMTGVAAVAKPWDLHLLRRMYPSLADAEDTPYARIAVVRRDAQVAVFENGALAFDTEGVGAEAYADLAAVQHPRPERALVIGGGGEGVPTRWRATASRSSTTLKSTSAPTPSCARTPSPRRVRRWPLTASRCSSRNLGAFSGAQTRMISLSSPPGSRPPARPAASTPPSSSRSARSG